MLPGMERRLAEHMTLQRQAASLAAAAEASEVPLLKGSFGHHSSAMVGLGNSSSQESLYGNHHHHHRHHIMTSGSLHSIRSSRAPSGSASAASTTIPVTAEIVPMPNVMEQHGNGTNSVIVVSSSASSSFMPVTSMVEATPASVVTSSSSQWEILRPSLPMDDVELHCTLPRPAENGYTNKPQRLQSVNSRLTSSASPPIHNNSMALATMPRNVTQHQNGGTWSPPPPPLPPHQGAPNGGTNTLPAKRKSVTIGTFTTVVEPFEISEEENMMSSAV